MSKEMFRGRPVLHCIEECDQFYADLFLMLDDCIGGEAIVQKDDICRHHFRSLIARLCDICYCHEPTVDVEETLIVYLGKPEPTDSV